MTRIALASREGLGILVCSIILGFTYTSVQEKGFFAPEKRTRVSLGSVAPEMIELQQALDLFQAGNAVFVDSRHAFDYKLGHILGALNLPLSDYDSSPEAVRSLPRNKTLVTYCDGAECNSSIELATKLKEAGFSDVRVFFGGWNEWQNQKLPTGVSP